jgi:hypothetical protein
VGDDTQSLTAEQVAEFLANNSDFLLQHPELIEKLEFEQVPEGTISLSQRQKESLRAKIQQLQEQLHALIDNARANTELQSQVHNLCLSLMDAADLDAMLLSLVDALKREFNADYVSLRLFYNHEALALSTAENNISQLHADAPELKEFDHMLSKQKPVCGRLTTAQKTFLFPQQLELVESIACIPLGHDPCAGLLAIASEDANRFHADMGTDYLSFLGDIVMRLLRLHGHQ